MYLRDKKGMRFILYWLPWISYCALIFSVSNISRPEEIAPIPFSDKFMHTIEYLILAFLSARAFLNSKSVSLNRHCLAAALIFSAGYGLSDEIHQIFVPNRNPSLWDWAFDILGSGLGTVLYLAWLRRAPFKFPFAFSPSLAIRDGSHRESCFDNPSFNGLTKPEADK